MCIHIFSITNRKSILILKTKFQLITNVNLTSLKNDVMTNATKGLVSELSHKLVKVWLKVISPTPKPILDQVVYLV
jgi:hypothetical protein